MTNLKAEMETTVHTMSSMDVKFTVAEMVSIFMHIFSFGGLIYLLLQIGDL